MTNSPFLEDYSSEDYEDYVDVNESQQQWLEVPKFQFWDGELDDEVLSDGVEAGAEIAVEGDEIESEFVEATTSLMIPAVTWNTLTDIDSARAGTEVQIHQRQDWNTMLSEGSSPAFIVGTMLKNWVERFLFEIALFRIRFYRSLAVAFRKATRWVTDWMAFHEKKE